MKKILILCFSMALCGLTHAQTEKEIRDHYQDINKKIADSKAQGMEGPLYCNEWTTNKNMRSWPAVGTFQETTQYWYDDDPNHISTKERDPKLVLLKVMVTRRAASSVTNEEYLFKDGKLVFFYSLFTEEGKGWETREWFNAKGVMFKSSVKYGDQETKDRELTAKDLAGEFSDSKPKPLQTKSLAKKYQDLFIKDMVYE